MRHCTRNRYSIAVPKVRVNFGLSYFCLVLPIWFCTRSSLTPCLQSTACRAPFRSGVCQLLDIGLWYTPVNLYMRKCIKRTPEMHNLHKFNGLVWLPGMKRVRGNVEHQQIPVSHYQCNIRTSYIPTRCFGVFHKKGPYNKGARTTNALRARSNDDGYAPLAFALYRWRITQQHILYCILNWKRVRTHSNASTFNFMLMLIRFLFLSLLSSRPSFPRYLPVAGRNISAPVHNVTNDVNVTYSQVNKPTAIIAVPSTSKQIHTDYHTQLQQQKQPPPPPPPKTNTNTSRKKHRTKLGDRQYHDTNSSSESNSCSDHSGGSGDTLQIDDVYNTWWAIVI